MIRICTYTFIIFNLYSCGIKNEEIIENKQRNNHFISKDVVMNPIDTIKFQYNNIKEFNLTKFRSDSSFRINSDFSNFNFKGLNIPPYYLSGYSINVNQSDTLFLFYSYDSLKNEKILVTKKENNKYNYISTLYSKNTHNNSLGYLSYLDDYQDNCIVFQFIYPQNYNIEDSSIFAIILDWSPQSFLDTLEIQKVSDLKLYWKCSFAKNLIIQIEFS